MAHQYYQTIYVADTDMAGVVYHANYIRFLEAARVDMLSNYGYPYHQLHQENIALAPIDLSIQYKAPLRLGDTCRVETSLQSYTTATVSYQQFIHLDKKLITSAKIKLACINTTTFKPMRIPTQLHSCLTN